MTSSAKIAVGLSADRFHLPVTDAPTRGASPVETAVAAGQAFASSLVEAFRDALPIICGRLALRAQTEMRTDRVQALHESVALLRAARDAIGERFVEVLVGSIRARLTGGVDPLTGVRAPAQRPDAGLTHHLLSLARGAQRLREQIDPLRLTRLHALLQPLTGQRVELDAALPASIESLLAAMDEAIASAGASLVARGFILEGFVASMPPDRLDSAYARLLDDLAACSAPATRADSIMPGDDALPPFVHRFLVDWWSGVIDRADLAGDQLARAEAERCAHDLAWSVLPKQVGDLPRLAAMLPDLLVHLRRGLAGSGIGEVQREAFFAAFVAHQVRLVVRARRAAGLLSLSLVGSGTGD
jgi:hypothetical protein